MMPIDAELIHKIAILAGDERGEPMVRAVAFDKLEAYRLSHPHPFVLPQEGPKTMRRPGRMLVTLRAPARRLPYRVVVFKHKKTPTFGALRINTMTDASTFIHGWWPTRDEALLGAWQALRAL
jgi:hypothetical protein